MRGVPERIDDASRNRSGGASSDASGRDTAATAMS